MEINDLGIITALVILSVLFITVPALADTPFRTALGLALTLFLPGYSLISALFPGKKDLGGLERLALGFGLSIAVVPLIGLALNYTPFGIRQEPVLYSVAAFTLICAIIAYSRRKSLKDERFKVSFDLKPNMPENKVDAALTVILCLAIVASIAALIYVIVAPKQGEKFTEFYIVGPGGMAENYPTSLKAGDIGTVWIGVVNREYEQVNYTLKIFLGNESLGEQMIRLSQNQTYSANFSFTPVRNGTEKLSFLLYRNQTSEEPYRSLHLWVKTG